MKSPHLELDWVGKSGDQSQCFVTRALEKCIGILVAITIIFSMCTPVSQTNSYHVLFLFGNLRGPGLRRIWFVPDHTADWGGQEFRCWSYDSKPYSKPLDIYTNRLTGK